MIGILTSISNKKYILILINLIFINIFLNKIESTKNI